MSLFFIIFLFIQAIAEESLYQGKLQKIQDFSDFDLTSLKGKPALFYFFQPSCESCQKQAKDFGCLPKDSRIFAIGVLGSYESLKKEFRRHTLRAIPLYGGPEWQKKWKIEKTPTLFGVNSQGFVVFKKEQRTECLEILEALFKK